MKGVYHDGAALTEKEIALAEKKAADDHERRMNYLIFFAYIVILVNSQSLRSADHLGLIISGYTAVSLLLLFGLESFWYRRNISEELYATAEHGQMRKEFRIAFASLMFTFAAMLSLMFDIANDNNNKLVMSGLLFFTSLSRARLSNRIE